MYTSRRTHILTLLVAFTAALGCASSAAQDRATFPERPVRIVVPFGPGGATDQIARLVAQGLGERWGQSVIVENKAGANGNIGALSVVRAAPDGYTLLMATSSHAVNTTLYKKLDYSLDT